jgi:hypothetical protein
MSGELPPNRRTGGIVMADKGTGYGRNWKKWLAIYAAVAVVVYFIVYLVFFTGGGGGATGGGLY